MKQNNLKPRKRNICPECGHIMIPESGCFYCRFCGYSMCSI